MHRRAQQCARGAKNREEARTYMTGIDLFEQAMMLSGMELEDAEALKPFALGCINQLLRDRAYLRA